MINESMMSSIPLFLPALLAPPPPVDMLVMGTAAVLLPNEAGAGPVIGLTGAALLVQLG